MHDDLYVLLNFHPLGQDIDRFNKYRLLDFKKMMLQTGLAISKNPLNRLYLGLGYRLFKEVQLDFLYFWMRYPDTDQIVTLADFASVDDGKKKFKQVYDEGHWAIGVSFYPRRVLGFLGL